MTSRTAEHAPSKQVASGAHRDRGKAGSTEIANELDGRVDRARSERYAAPARPRCSGAGSAVALVDQPQAVQRQVRLVVVEGLADLEHQLGQASGGQDDRLPAELVGDAANEPVHLAGEAVEQPRLQRLRGRLADDRARLDQLDLEQARRTGRERVDADLDPWGECAAEELPRADTTSKFVEVPKSTTMAGPPYNVWAARVFTMRSGPTSRGLS